MQSIRPAFANYDNIEELNNPSPYFPGLATDGGNIGEESDGGPIRPEDLYSKITSVASRYQDDCGIHIQITNANTVFQLIAWLVLAEGATGQISDKKLLLSIFPEIRSFAYICFVIFSEFTTDLMSDAASLFATGGGVLSGDCPQDMKELAGVITMQANPIHSYFTQSSIHHFLPNGTEAFASQKAIFNNRDTDN